MSIIYHTEYHFEFELSDDEHFAGYANVWYTVDDPDPSVGFEGDVDVGIENIKGYITGEDGVEHEVELCPGSKRWKAVVDSMRPEIESYCWESYREDIKPFERSGS